MEQSGNKYRTVSGLSDGEKVTSEWSHAEAKNVGRSNETTSIEQATAEIEAKYKKQLKTGYHTNVKDVDVSSYVEPMLAQPLHKLSKQPDFSKEKWGMQCKFNGNRCIATKDGLFTRKGEKYMSVLILLIWLKVRRRSSFISMMVTISVKSPIFWMNRPLILIERCGLILW